MFTPEFMQNINPLDKVEYQQQPVLITEESCRSYRHTQNSKGDNDHFNGLCIQKQKSSLSSTKLSKYLSPTNRTNANTVCKKNNKMKLKHTNSTKSTENLRKNNKSPDRMFNSFRFS